MKTLAQLQAERNKLVEERAEKRRQRTANLNAAATDGSDAAAVNKRDDDFKAALAAYDRRVEAIDGEIEDAQAKAEADRRAPARSSIAVAEGWERDPKRGFATERDFFVAVHRAGLSVAAGYPNSIPANLRSLMTPAQATAGSDEQSGSSASYGGFHIPVALVPGVEMTAVESDPLMGLTRPVPMTAPTVLINARVDKNHATSVSGGLRVYRRAEAGSVTASRMQFEQIELRADAMMGIAYATEEVLRDSPISIAALLASGFRDEFGAKKISERLNGSGVGEFLGVNEAACKIDVAKEAGQAGGTIVRQNIVKMRARCWRYSGAVWLANHDTLPQLLELKQPGDLFPMFSTDSEGVDRLYGRPIKFTEFCASVGTVGDIELVVPSEYLEGEYEPIQGATSMHVRFEQHEQAFKFYTRNAGAPWWRSVLTPKNGATLAPVVRLATRS